MTAKKKGVPSNKSAACFAAQAMFTLGPQTKESILMLANFGDTPGRQVAGLNRALQTRWLIERAGRIELSEYALQYFGGSAPAPKTVGSLATPRENLHAMEPLSRKHYLNVKGPRADAPDVRAFPSVYAKVTP